MRGRTVDDYDAPLFIAWQLTNRCSARCIACCEESGPDKAWGDELTRAEAVDMARYASDGWWAPYQARIGPIGRVSRHDPRLAAAQIHGPRA